MTRKVKAVKAWAIVNPANGIAVVTWAGERLAAYGTRASAKRVSTVGERVIPVRITPITKKKGKANG